MCVCVCVHCVALARYYYYEELNRNRLKALKASPERARLTRINRDEIPNDTMLTERITEVQLKYLNGQLIDASN